MAFIPSSSSVIAFQKDVDKLIVTVAGSVATVGSAPANQSVSGTVNLGPTSVTALQGTNPWFVQLTSGSVLTSGGNSSVLVVGTMPPQSVSGVGLFNINPVGNGSVITVSQGSVAAAQSGAWAVSVVGGPLNINSILGTYPKDTASSQSAPGLFHLGMRNDTMSSVTSADLNYSPHGVGPVGETISANSPITKWLSGQTSVMYGTSVQAIAPQGASVFTYITGIEIANNSANASLVKFTGGLGSVLGWTIAPATGGSNIQLTNPWRTGENSGVSASISGVSSVYVTMQGFTAKI